MFTSTVLFSYSEIWKTAVKVVPRLCNTHMHIKVFTALQCGVTLKIMTALAKNATHTNADTHVTAEKHL